MPRIAAPTVAANHEMRRAALIAAAGDLLASGGAAAVTPAAVGSAAGLARSSVYLYFPSVPALLAEVIEQELPRLTRRIADEVARAQTPLERVRAFVTAAIAAGVDPMHQALAGLSEADLPAEHGSRIGELHREQLAPLQAALAELGVREPGLVAQLVYGTIGAAVSAVGHGADQAQVVAASWELVAVGVRGCSSGAGSQAGVPRLGGGNSAEAHG